MNELDYHNHPALSQSKLKLLAESPRKFYHRYILKLPQTETEHSASKQLGTCWDVALTEPKQYQALIVKDGKTTTVKNAITTAWKQQIDNGIANLNAYELTLPEFAKGDKYFTFGEIAKRCEKQNILFWNDPKTGIACRGKPDFTFYKNGVSFMVDLKTTKAVTFDEFYRDFIKFGYYLQAAMYCTGERINRKLNYYPAFYFIAVSTITGEIFCIKVSDQMLTMGLIEMDGLIALYQYCESTNDWAKNKPPVIADLPDWKTKQIINMYSQEF